jgi:sarcosine oxidase
MKNYQTIIIGLGAMGSAAAYQLAKRGNAVLGIDQLTPPHVLGSTHGETRITRQANGEGPAYAPLALRSHEIWRELEARSNVELLTVTGGLIISPADGSNVVHGKADFIEQTVQSAEQFDISHELLSGKEARKRFPQFNTRDKDQVYFEPGAGFVRPEKCLQVQLDLARELGAEIHINEKTLSFYPDGDGVRVITTAGEYYADKLIVSAGPWAGELLGEEFGDLLKVYRQALFWFAVDNPKAFTPSTFPVFIWDLGDGDDMYGFPSLDNGVSGIKIATEQYVDPTTPETVERGVTEEEKTEMYERRIKGRIVGAKNVCLNALTCLYTVTPDHNFIIDTLPNIPQIIVASPCSGHGFKHSAAIGEALAELAIDGQSKLDISSFGLKRFARV